jgi:endonuclease/exonuclease/phosphatase family metal-dependent hydrolase
MTLTILILLLWTQVLPIIFFQEPSAPAKQAQPKQPHPSDNSVLIEFGQATKLRSPSPNGDMRIVSYNIRWRSGEDLKKIIKLFREDTEIGNPTIIALQEVDRQKQRSGKTNTAKLLADELGLYYAWAAPPTPKADAEEETGVAILSTYPLSDVCRIVLPHAGPGKRRRVALGASIKAGENQIRIYSVHAETRISMDKKLDQLNIVLADLKEHSTGPAVVMGDFNTWQTDAAPKTIKLFSDAGFTTPFGSQKTFSQKVLFVPVNFRLDWIWMRGLEAVNHGIDREIEISDHWPLWTSVKLKEPSR